VYFQVATDLTIQKDYSSALQVQHWAVEQLAMGKDLFLVRLVLALCLAVILLVYQIDSLLVPLVLA